MLAYEQADTMPQLNVHVPRESSLLERIEAAARALGTSPSSLARAVLEAALEPYVQAHLELRDQVHVRLVSAAAVETQRDLRSGAIPMLPITEGEAAQQEVDVAPDQQPAAVAAT
jgi:hypothetical protein